MHGLKIAMVAGLALASGVASASVIDTAYAPGNDLSLTVSAISSAQRWIELNIYELTSPDIASALVGRIQAGVEVLILAEGQPVGGLSAAGKGVQAELVAAMSRFPRTDHFYEMTAKAGATRRFHYDHAKYAVIDGTSVLIGSENYSPTGNPEPGTVGNRGWEVWIHDTAVAAEFSHVFQNDIQVSAGDILELTGNPQAQAAEGLRAARPPMPSRVPLYAPAQVGVLTMPATQVVPITAPDTSLAGLVATIRSARSSLDIEQMSFKMDWGPPGTASPLFTEVVAAARRGVRVRVLLNDERAFNDATSSSGSSAPINPATVQQLNLLAARERLQLEARIANVKAMGVDYIHNKGVLVDSVGTLVSSINWDENAVEKNREAAVLIESAEVNAFYSRLFASDWAASAPGVALRGR